jgi:hypothetical protein
MKATLLITSIALSLGLATACGKSDSEPASSAADKPAPTAPAAAAPETDIREETLPAKRLQPEYSEGMRIPVDGSSLESFDQSLAAIKAETTAEEYSNLTNAIDYLLVYNLSAKRDRAKLAQWLDGKTGAQIISQANANQNAD